jgi:ADP-L-glycero-D-manno-heptose 6-epimerase
LQGDGHDVVVADDFSSARWSNLVSFGGDVVTVDVAGNIAALYELGHFDVIFHQASITDTTVVDQRKMMHNNVEGFRQILALAERSNSRLIWASSASIYGRGAAPMVETQASEPLNVYAFSKLTMERMAQRWNARLAEPIVGLRYFNVYGPGEDHKGKFASMIHQLAAQMRAGKRPRIFTAGQQRRDFVHVDDVVQANINAMTARESGVFNAGSGNGDSFNQVVAELNRVLRTDLPPEYFHNPYSFTQDWTQADLTRSKQVLGYQPKYGLADGITAYHASGALGVGN